MCCQITVRGDRTVNDHRVDGRAVHPTMYALRGVDGFPVHAFICTTPTADVTHWPPKLLNCNCPLQNHDGIAASGIV